MAQTINAKETDSVSESMDQRAPAPLADFSAWAILAERLVQNEVRRRISANHMAGRPVYFGGTGVDIGKVFTVRPDGRPVQVRVLGDGSLEEIGEVAG